MNQIFRHAITNSLVSLTANKCERVDNNATLSLIFSVVVQTNLQKLRLNDLNYRTNQIAWPIQSTLEKLTIGYCSYQQYRVILCNSLRLRTLAIRNWIMDNTDETASSYALTTFDSTGRVKCVPFKYHLSYRRVSNSFPLHKIRTRLKTLTTIDLSHNEISDIGAQHLANTLRNHQTLTILDLSRNRIGNNGMQYLHDTFKENKTLIQLNLAGNPGSYCATVSAAIQIRNDKTITKMNLCEKSIDDSAMKFLTNALVNNETIIELDLSDNKMGDIGTKHLADALQNNKVTNNLYQFSS
ncbi:unnamed protein product [Adineta steineri]|uniref:Uncharacterized protein n=1 Tax=Adineta steineri TaxID=433720 RepID=A0A815QR33_9BILA|nr:unnamed protein product [Adineta steineri]